MNKKERTKETISILINLGIVLVMSLFFYYIWQKYYHERIFFYRRGNWFLLLVYASTLTVLNYVFGGFRLGYAKLSDLIFSQSLALLFANLMIYIISAFVRREFLPIRGFAIYYGIQVEIGRASCRERV